MLCAPAVVWEISAPPTTPRGTSRSSPGLTTFMAASLPSRRRRDGAAGFRAELDLQRRLSGRLVVDLQRRVSNPEALAQHRLQLAPAAVTVVARADHDV